MDQSCALKSIQRHNTPCTMPFDVTWQHWEDFVARYWCLKTSVFAVSWQFLHNGALFKTGCDFKVLVKQLQLVTATNHCSTDSTLTTEINTDAGTIKPIEGKHHVISASGIPAGDSFCFVSSEPPVAFSLSCKHCSRSRGRSDYKQEHSKATKGREDFFIEYSTGSYPSLPLMICQMTGVVWFVRRTSKVILGPTLGKLFS